MRSAWQYPAGMHCPWWDDAFVSSYRQDAAKRQTAGVVFTHRPKIRFFAPQGRLVAPSQIKLCRTNGHLGPLGCAKFHANRCRGLSIRPPKYQKFPFFGKESPRRGDWLHRFRSNFAGPTGNWVRLIGCAKFHVNRCTGVGMRPQKYKKKFPLFGKESPRRGDSLDRFRNFRGFYAAKYPTLVFQISCDSLTGYGVIAEKPCDARLCRPVNQTNYDIKYFIKL